MLGGDTWMTLDSFVFCLFLVTLFQAKETCNWNKKKTIFKTPGFGIRRSFVTKRICFFVASRVCNQPRCETFNCLWIKSEFRTPRASNCTYRVLNENQVFFEVCVCVELSYWPTNEDICEAGLTFIMAAPQYWPISFNFPHGTLRLARSSSSSSSSDKIDEIFTHVPRSNAKHSYRTRRHLTQTSSRNSTNGQPSRHLRDHCNKCHQIRLNRWNQRYSSTSSSPQPRSPESKLDIFVPITVDNEHRRSWRANRG